MRGSQFNITKTQTILADASSWTLKAYNVGHFTSRIEWAKSRMAVP
jgi:hypothetical protein